MLKKKRKKKQHYDWQTSFGFTTLACCMKWHTGAALCRRCLVQSEQRLRKSKPSLGQYWWICVKRAWIWTSHKGADLLQIRTCLISHKARLPGGTKMYAGQVSMSLNSLVVPKWSLSYTLTFWRKHDPGTANGRRLDNFITWDQSFSSPPRHPFLYLKQPLGRAS